MLSCLWAAAGLLVQRQGSPQGGTEGYSCTVLLLYVKDINDMKAHNCWPGAAVPCSSRYSADG